VSTVSRQVKMHLSKLILAHSHFGFVINQRGELAATAVTDEPVGFERYRIEVQGFRKTTHH